MIEIESPPRSLARASSSALPDRATVDRARVSAYSMGLRRDRRSGERDGRERLLRQGIGSLQQRRRFGAIVACAPTVRQLPPGAGGTGLPATPDTFLQITAQGPG